MTTKQLADKLAPKVQEAMDGARRDIIDHAGGPVARAAVAVAFPVARREVPVFVEHGLAALGRELSEWTVGDVLAWLGQVAAAEGRADCPLRRDLRAMGAIP